MQSLGDILLAPRQVIAPIVEPASDVKDWKQTAAYLITKGFTQHEIALATQRSEATIGALLGTDSFRQLVEIQAKTNGSAKSSATALLSGAASLAAQTIIKLAASSSSDAVRLRAAQDVLDRSHGRAIQTVYTQNASCDLDPSTEVKQLKADILRQMKHLGPSINLQVNTNVSPIVSNEPVL